MAENTNESPRADDIEDQAQATLNDINKRAGRNMPQAIATGAALVILIVLSLVFRIDVFVGIVVIFMLIALWELRVDFATVGLCIPVVALWICSAATLLITYYFPLHNQIAAVCIIISTLVILIASSIMSKQSARAEAVVASKIRNSSENAQEARPKPVQERYNHVIVSLFSLFYITVLATFIILSLTIGHPVAHAMMLVFVPALGDIGGLIFGAWLGKHKLSPRISPKKSVEGLLGSVLFTTVGMIAIGYFTYSSDIFQVNWWMLAVIGVISGIVGLFGDLSASMLKRDMGLKDMGHLLKGHGGVLDRVDSILMCAPVMFALLVVFGL